MCLTSLATTFVVVHAHVSLSDSQSLEILGDYVTTAVLMHVQTIQNVQQIIEIVSTLRDSER